MSPIPDRNVTMHDELEHKYEADQVEPRSFLQWAWGRGPTEYLLVKGPDAYYRQGRSVVRYRIDGTGKSIGELTVKSRRGDDSENCQEIDLKFAPGIGVTDVQAFLDAAGFKREFTLIKECHIFWYKHHNVVLYDVWRLDDPENTRRRFLEVEVEKDSGLPMDKALELLKEQSDELRRFFKVGKRINKRLYELYSGKRLRMENA